MIEFISLLISFMIMAAANSIDTAFANNISMDGVIVASCYTAVCSIVNGFAGLSGYSYRIHRSEENKTFTLSLLWSFMIGILAALLAVPLSNAFHITNDQRILLRQLLYLSPVMIVLHTANNCLLEITRLKNNLREYNRGMILFYFPLILLDLLVFLIYPSIILLYVTTMISRVLSVLYLYYKCGYKICRIDKSFIKMVFYYGVPVIMERLLNYGSKFIFLALMTRMDSYHYPISVICYGITSEAEAVTNAYNATLMIQLNTCNTCRETLKKLKKSIMKYLAVLLPVYIIFCTISLFITHGVVPVSDCFSMLIIYELEFFSVFLYETGKVLLVMNKHVSAMPLSTISAYLIRIGVCLLFLRSSYLYIVAPIVIFADWLCRGIYYGIVYYFDYRKEQHNRVGNGQFRENPV